MDISYMSSTSVVQYITRYQARTHASRAKRLYRCKGESQTCECLEYAWGWGMIDDGSFCCMAIGGGG